jgi:peptide/nickel transport system permease protein
MIIRRIKRQFKLLFGVVILIFLISCSIFAFLLTAQRPAEQNLLESRLPPCWHFTGSREHILGTDYLGRDVWANILYGGRFTFLVAFSASLSSALVGTVIGLIAGYFGGLIDLLLTRIIDIQLAIPAIVLALTIAALTKPGLENLIIALAITSWPSYARLIRALAKSLSRQTFVEAARSIGANSLRILFHHLLPNCFYLVLVQLTLETARIVLTESALSFLGLGLPPPYPSWGRMLAENRLFLTVDYWVTLFPGLAIMLTVLGINLLGDGLRDFLDPRLRRML